MRAGRTPKRQPGVEWRKALDGNTSKTAWIGLHPLDDLVQIENPASGYMQNDNIAPSKMFEGSPLTKTRYPDYIYNDDADRISSRGRRTVAVLSRAWAFTVADAKELALDEHWIDTEIWQQSLRRSLERDLERARTCPRRRRSWPTGSSSSTAMPGPARPPRWASGIGGRASSRSRARRPPPRCCRAAGTARRRRRPPRPPPSTRWSAPPAFSRRRKERCARGTAARTVPIRR